MFPTYSELPGVALQRQSELLAAAARDRLIREARAARSPRRYAPLRVVRLSLAAAFYALAVWLDDRAEPAPAHPAHPAHPAQSEPLLQW